MPTAAAVTLYNYFRDCDLALGRYMQSSPIAETSIESWFESSTRIGSYMCDSSARMLSTTGSTHNAFEEPPMDIKPIRTKRDHEATLKAIEGLMGAS